MIGGSAARSLLRRELPEAAPISDHRSREVPALPNRSHPGRRKALGQHFLAHRGIIQRILELLEISADDRFLEIGPGRGALTLDLARRAAALVAVEIDPVLAESVRQLLAGSRHARLIQADILDLAPARWLRPLGRGAPGGPVRVVGNLPYRISTAVVQRFLGRTPRVRDFHFMFQKEVAERLTARPGTGAYGYISVLTQVHCRARILLRIPASAFRPPPRVESAFVGLWPRTDRPWKSASREERFRAFLRGAFANRRKTLVNNLRNAPGADPRRIADRLEALGLPRAVRAEEISPGLFLRLFGLSSRGGVLI